MNSDTDDDKSNPSSILFKGIPLDQLDSQLLASNNMFIHNGNNYQQQIQFYQQQLRGGGCCLKNSRSYPYKIAMFEEIPSYFAQHMIEHSKILDSKSLSLQNKQDKLRVISSIQWFINNQKHFNTLCLDQQQATKFIGCIKISLELLLKSILNYITASGYICIELLSQSNMLVRVLFCYYTKLQTKILNQTFIETLENHLTELETLVNTNTTQCWEFGIEFEISIMKIAFSHIPTKIENSNNLSLGILQSLAQLQLSDQLIQTVFQYVKQVLQKFVGKVKNPIEKYEVYCIFEGMKWNIIYQITQRHQIQNIKIQLENLYIQFIKNSKEWILHYCWIKLISDLLTYRPIVDKDSLLKDIKNSIEKKRKFRDLIKGQCIEKLPYNINYAKCICFPNNTNAERSKFLKEFSNLGLNELAEFQLSLMNLDKQSDQQFWQFYILYRQDGEKDNELNKQNQQIQVLFNFIPIFQHSLDYLKCLLENNQIIIEKMNKLSKNLQYELDEANSNYQSELLDQNSKIQTNIIEMIYVINEIHLYIISMIYYLGFITESLILEDKSKFYSIVQSIKDIYVFEYLKCLNLLPQNLIGFLQARSEQENKLNNNFQRGTIENPIENITNQSIEQLRIESENIFKKVKEYKMIFEDQIYTKKLKRAELIQEDQFKLIVGFKFEHFFTIFLNGIISNINEILKNINDTQNEKNMYNHYYSIYTSLKISRFLLHIMQVRFQKNEPYQVMEALSSRRQGTIEDEIQNQNNDIKILVQQQKEYIEKLLSDDSKGQKGISTDKLIDLVKRNINEIKNMHIKSDIHDNILKQMALIFLDLMKLPDFLGIDSKQQLEIICNMHKEIFSIIDQEHSFYQPQNSRQSDSKSCIREKILLPNFDPIIKKLMILIRKTELLMDTFEIKKKIQSDQDVENSAAQTRKEILKYIKKLCNDLEENKIDLDKNLELLFFGFAANYDKQIPYSDVYQFLEILQTFDLKDYHHQQPLDDLSNDNQPYINLVKFYYKLKLFNPDHSVQQRDQQRIKQCLCYQIVKMNNIILEEILQNFSNRLIIQIWLKETDQKVKSLLQNKEMIEIQTQLYCRNSEESEQEIERNVKAKLSEFDVCYNCILQEVDEEKIEQLKLQLQEIETDLGQYVLNLSDIQDKLKINIITLIELKREFNHTKQKLQQLQFKLDNIERKIARLIGKSPEELFEIRKKNYEYKMNKNKFEELYTEQYFRQVIQGKDSKFHLHELIKNFMQDKHEQVMLIQGRSGVGKTTAMNKIEQQIWKNQLLDDDIKIIPISAQLADLKTPTINIFKEILMSDKYGFNENQVQEFKEALTQTKIQVVFLLNSYDEMSNEFRYQNLYVSNGFSEFYNKNYNRNAIKCIIDCRKEFIKQSQLAYQQQEYQASQLQTWFGFEKHLTEVELLELDDEQITNFLQQYTKLSVLYEIQNFQDKVIKQFEYNQISLFQSSKDWMNLLSNMEMFESQSQEQLLNNNQLDEVINYLKTKNYCLQQNQHYINQLKILRDNLSRLWSEKQYQKFSKKLQLQELMKIPYLIKLILDVLPTLEQNQHFSEKLNQFVQNYSELMEMKILQKSIISKMDQSKNQKQKTDQQSWKRFLKSCYLEIKQEIDLNVLSFQQKGLFTKMFNSNLSDEDLQASMIQLEIEYKNCEDVIKARQEKQITQYDFLDGLTQAYMEKQTLNLKLKSKIKDEGNFKQDVTLFADNFSLEMIQNQELSVLYSPQGQLQTLQKFLWNTRGNWQDRYFHDKDITHEYFSLIRSAILITQRGDTFSFCHEKIPQFYVAKAIYKLINAIQLQEDNSFMNYLQEEQFEINETQKKKQTEFIKNSWLNSDMFNLSQPQYKEVFEILKGKVMKDYRFKKKLIHLIKISPNQNMKYAASNIISFLCFITKDLSNQILKDVELVNTSLIGIDFSNSDLSNSKFTNVNISDCNFTGTNLDGANWQNILHYNIKKNIKNCQNIFQLNHKLETAKYMSSKKIFQLELKNIPMEEEIFKSSKEFKCFDISYDGQYLAYAEMNSQDIQIYNFIKSSYQQTLMEEKDFVDLLRFSKQKDQLASVSKDSISIWNWQKKTKIQVIDIQGYKLCSLLFSQNKIYLALHLENQFIQLRQGQNWASTQIIYELSDQVSVFTFSFDQMMASVSSNEQNSKTIQLYNISQCKKEIQLKGHQDKTNCLLFLSDKRTLISGGDDCLIILWNYRTGEQQGRVQTYQKKIQFLNIQNDNRILGYLNENKSLNYMDLQAFRSVHQIKHPLKKINSILFSKDGLILISCNFSKAITLWDMKEGKRLKKIKDLQYSNVISIAISVTGQFLASANEEGTIAIQNFHSNQVEKLLYTSATIKKIKFSQDEKYLAYLCEKNELKLRFWQKSRGKEKQPKLPQEMAILDFCFSGDSKIFIFAANSIFGWNYLEKSEETTFLKKFKLEVKYFEFSQRGQYFAILDSTNELKCYNLQRVRIQFQKVNFENVICIAFSQNDEVAQLAIGMKENIQIIDVLKRGKSFVIALKQEIEFLQFSPNDFLLASVFKDNTIKIFDILTKQQIFTLPCSPFLLLNNPEERKKGSSAPIIRNFLNEDMIN